MQQEKISISSNFITLTYGDQQASKSKKGWMELNVRHLQLFFKRLRKISNTGRSQYPIRYYAAGEYGGITSRPHYHVIIFNATIEAIEKAWTYGNIHYGKVSGASIGYTLKYISKPSKIPLHGNDDRKKEFSVMSKRMGLSYLTKQMVQWHKNDILNRMYINIGDGKKASMPRYFKDKIYTKEEREKIAAIGLIRGIEKSINAHQRSGDRFLEIREQRKFELIKQTIKVKDSL